jgi:DNA polymerase (family 10)
MAKNKGAKFIVSTDSHHPKHLENMRYGVLTARRGGLAAADILNTYSAPQMIRALGERKGSK